MPPYLNFSPSLSPTSSTTDTSNTMGFHGITSPSASSQSAHHDRDAREFERWARDPSVSPPGLQGATLPGTTCSQIEHAVRGDARGMHRALPLKHHHVHGDAAEARFTGHSQPCFAEQKARLWDAYAKAVAAKVAGARPGTALIQAIRISQDDVGASAVFACNCGGSGNVYALAVKENGVQSVAWNKVGEPTVKSARKGGIVGMPTRK